MTILCWRGLALWVIGYPEAALADADHALKDAREIGQAVTLMAALLTISLTHLCCRSYDTANVLVDELVALANEKGASLWRASGMSRKGCLLAAVGEASSAVQMVTSAITALRSTGFDSVGAVVSSKFGQRLCGDWTTRCCFALHLRGHHGGGNDQREVVRS